MDKIKVLMFAIDLTSKTYGWFVLAKEDGVLSEDEVRDYIGIVKECVKRHFDMDV